ncbi:hypothetical protein DOP62_14295 (plasmid) [Synechococcus elongatus PCC 11801]|uniref:Uncharacterized protein n=1 Tax=Synechococcus elongatus PCC 11801 TaxID=2219813 RepID=A0ACD5A330_SYNEL
MRPKVYGWLKRHQPEEGEVLATLFPAHAVSGDRLLFTVAHVTTVGEPPAEPAAFTGILDPARPGELLVLPKNHPAFGLNIEGLPAVSRRGVYRLSVLLTPAMQLRSIADPEWVGAA